MTTLSLAFASGFAASAVLIVAIGAQNLFVLRQGMRGQHVGAVVLFCAGADAALIAVGVAGLGAVLGSLPGLSMALTLGGAAFLSLYGARALLRAARPSAMSVEATAPMSLGAVMLGLAGFTFLNPHVYLDTVLLMGALGSSQPADMRPAFVLGAATASLSWFAALGYGARLLTPLFAKPSSWRVLDGLVGATMIALAGGLVVGAFK
jgi:L-lysine exporter family protein LysE/ArgO